MLARIRRLKYAYSISKARISLLDLRTRVSALVVYVD